MVGLSTVELDIPNGDGLQTKTMSTFIRLHYLKIMKLVKKEEPWVMLGYRKKSCLADESGVRQSWIDVRFPFVLQDRYEKEES